MYDTDRRANTKLKPLNMRQEQEYFFYTHWYHI